MGLYMKLANWARHRRLRIDSAARHAQRPQHHCHLESLEERQMMAADIELGAVYFEPAAGLDQVGNTFTVAWQGGAPGTQLTQLVVDLDKNGNGTLDDGECFFNTAAGGLGVYGYTPFTVDSITAGASITNVSVPNGSQKLVIDFSNFTAGDKLVFQVDVDEMGHDAHGNPSVSAVAEGKEFEGSLLRGTFTNPDYQTADGSGKFIDAFNPELQASGLPLPPDNYVPPSTIDETVFTAGTMFPLTQIPLPSSIAGHVQYTVNGTCDDPAATPYPIAGVQIELLDANGQLVRDAQGNLITTTTDADGNYKFTNLLPGTYGVREVQPAGYLEGDNDIGSLGGNLNGVNEIDGISLTANSRATDYDFCEQLPATVAGYVYVVTNGNCNDPNATRSPIPGVTLQLVDANGLAVLDSAGQAITTTTDSAGHYQFTNLTPGTYGVREVQPAGYLEGCADVGTVNGAAIGNISTVDYLSGIVLKSDQQGINYNFEELLPVTISGKVIVSYGGDCNDPTATHLPLAGVTISLVDSNGVQVVDGHGNPITAVTAADGTYSFSDLAPGSYGVRLVTPDGYLNDDSDVGTVAGQPVGSAPDVTWLTGIDLVSGQAAIDYDFCLIAPAEISGYVFVDGPTITVVSGSPITSLAQVPQSQLVGRTGQLNPGDEMLAGVTLILADASGNVLLDSAGQPIETITDANGYYHFSGLLPGVYSVIEVSPSGYFDWINTPGSTGGQADFPGNTIMTIALTSGDASINNNFSELRAVPIVYVIPPLVTPGPPLAYTPLTPAPTPVAPPPALPPVVVITSVRRSGGDVDGSTWHLSVINAGQPRAGRAMRVSASLSKGGWAVNRPQTSRWLLRTGDNPEDVQQFIFGVCHSLPITGDFNGDGRTDLGVFQDGQWYVDLNGNGRWDADDLWVKLGERDDLPVTGDWDGDAKSDVAIFGRAWSGDPQAIQNEPGLPHPDNALVGEMKNARLKETEAPHGVRAMQRTSAGTVRADLIDHVFAYGTAGDRPVAGNFNGSGIDTIGVFRDGRWDLDLDGDGKHKGTNDVSFQYGEPGDLPVVGDFNGDGQDEIGIYRSGVWVIDTNNNRVLDDADMVIRFGRPGDIPVVGDWDGDGREDVGVYQDCAVEQQPDAKSAPATDAVPALDKI